MLSSSSSSRLIRPVAMSSSASAMASRRIMHKKRNKVSKKSLSPIASMSQHNKKEVHTLGIDIHALIDSISENSPDMITDFKEMMITNKMITDIMYSKPGALKTFFAAAKVNIFDETATEDDYRKLCHSIMIYCMINPTYLSRSFKKVRKPVTEKIRYSIGGSKSKKKRTTSQEQKRKAKKDKQNRLFRNRIIIILLLSAGLFTFMYFLPSIIIFFMGTGKIAVAAIGAAEAFRRRFGIDLVDDSVTATLSPFGHQLYYWISGILLTFQTIFARTFVKLLTAENTAQGDAAWKTMGIHMDEIIENSFSSRNIREITTAAAKEGETAKENIKAISATVAVGGCRAIGGGLAAVAGKLIDKDSFTGRFIEGATQSPNENDARKHQQLIKDVEKINKELYTITTLLKKGPSTQDKQTLTAKKMALLEKHAKRSAAILSYQTLQLSGGPNVDNTMSNALAESFAKLSTNDEVLPVPVPVPVIKDVSTDASVDSSSDASKSSSISSSMDSRMSSMDSSTTVVATPSVDSSTTAVAIPSTVDNSAVAIPSTVAIPSAVDNSAVAIPSTVDNSASTVDSSLSSLSPSNTNS